jgi:hypothetical protein
VRRDSDIPAYLTFFDSGGNLRRSISLQQRERLWMNMNSPLMRLQRRLKDGASSGVHVDGSGIKNELDTPFCADQVPKYRLARR